jgi:hypothetical protein
MVALVGEISFAATNIIVLSPQPGARSANVQPCLANGTILVDVCHDAPCSPLRRVPEVPHSISGWFQSIP